MKKESIKTFVLMIICLSGALLIGFNAGKLSNGINLALFIVGIVLISVSTTIISLLETIFKKKDKKK